MIEIIFADNIAKIKKPFKRILNGPITIYLYDYQNLPNLKIILPDNPVKSPSPLCESSSPETIL